jgi:hypothetical protein
MSQTKNTLFMETTKISADRSAAEITAALIKGGAKSISTDYEGRRIVGLEWVMKLGTGEVRFKMPARIDPVHKLLLTEAKRSSRWRDDERQKIELREKAERVAWRQLLRWVQAQMAMIDCGMSEMTEVFFPYVQASNGETIYALAKASQFKQLSAGKPQ